MMVSSFLIFLSRAGPNPVSWNLEFACDIQMSGNCNSVTVTLAQKDEPASLVVPPFRSWENPAGLSDWILLLDKEHEMLQGWLGDSSAVSDLPDQTHEWVYSLPFSLEEHIHQMKTFASMIKTRRTEWWPGISQPVGITQLQDLSVTRKL